MKNPPGGGWWSETARDQERLQVTRLYFWKALGIQLLINDSACHAQSPHRMRNVGYAPDSRRAGLALRRSEKCQTGKFEGLGVKGSYADETILRRARSNDGSMIVSGETNLRSDQLGGGKSEGIDLCHPALPNVFVK
jgi:hypothetical protein